MIKIDPNKIIKNMYKGNKKGRALRYIISVLCILILLIAIFFVVCKYYFYPLKHFDIIKSEAAKNNIDPYLVLSIIKAESKFNKHATSSKEAKGLMQIMDSTAEDIKNNMDIDNNKKDLYDEEVNISLGCKYFSYLIKKYEGNYYLAVCAYNAGMGNVDKWIEQGIVDKNLSEYINVNIPFNETKKYLRKVISSYKIYRLLYK